MSPHALKIENWHELSCRLFWAYEGPVGYRFQHGAYRQEGVVAWLIMRGHVTLTFARGQEHCTAGHWFFPKREAWSQDFSDDAEIISLRFTTHWPDGTSLFDRSRSIQVPMAEVPRLTSLAHRIARYAHTNYVADEVRVEHIPKSLDRYIDMQRLFLSWMTTYVDLMRSKRVAVSAHQPLDERVWLTINRIERAELHEPLREADLAQVAGVSKSHLNRLFAINIGKSPAEYLEERRIRVARSALLESTRSVKTIAYELGFSSLSHFSTWVTKKLGQSPRELRKAFAKAGVKTKKQSELSANPHYTSFPRKRTKPTP